MTDRAQVTVTGVSSVTVSGEAVSPIDSLPNVDSAGKIQDSVLGWDVTSGTWKSRPAAMKDTANTFTVTDALRATQTGATSFRLLRVNNDISGRGAFVLDAGQQTFNGTPEPIAYFGYNGLVGGTLLLAGEPALLTGYEANYNDGSGVNKVEHYIQYIHTNLAYNRPLFVQWRRDTGAITALELTGGSGTTFKSQAGDNILNAQALTTQAGALWLGYNAVDGVAKIAPFGSNKVSVTVAGLPLLRGYQSGNGANNSPAWTIGEDTNVALLTLAQNGGDNSLVGLLVKAHSSRLTDLLRSTDQAGTTVYTRLNKDGYFMTRKVAAPADGDLAASEMALWLDATNGAAKLMVKAKQADGTVRTASVALA